MALPALASVADLEGRLGRQLDPDEASRAALLLSDASEAVRSYTGQQFTPVVSTVRLQVVNGEVRLPQRPVNDVTAVDDLDGNPVMFTWWFGDRIALTGPWTPYVDVTYDHGYAEIPGEIVGLVCNQVARALGNAPDLTGYQQEQIGTYSYTIGPAAAAGAFGLLNDERAVLNRYRRLVGAIRIDAR